jgi:hypothetical protein
LCISEIDIAGVGVGFEMEISVVDLLVAEFSPNPIATAASPAITHMTARRIEASLPVQIEIGVVDVRAGNRGRSVSYFTLRTIIVLMETMKDFYSSTTIPPSAAVATRRCDLRVNEYAA